MLSAARARPVLRVDDGADLAGPLDVLAGGDPQGADSGVRRPDVPVTGPGRVTLLVDADAEEAEPAGGPGPDLGGVLPDAAGEHQRVQAAQGGRHRGHA